TRPLLALPGLSIGRADGSWAPAPRRSLVGRQEAVIHAQPVGDEPGDAVVLAATVASPVGVPRIGVPSGLGALRRGEDPIELGRRGLAARRGPDRDVVAMRVLRRPRDEVPGPIPERRPRLLDVAPPAGRRAIDEVIKRVALEPDRQLTHGPLPR